METRVKIVCKCGMQFDRVMGFLLHVKDTHGVTPTKEPKRESAEKEEKAR